MSSDVNTIDWNPWTGCQKCGNGCRLCTASKYIIRNNSHFKVPIQKKRVKKKYKIESYELQYKVEPGTVINTCTNSDFFLPEAESMRNEAWQIIHDRYDCLFHIKTRRPEYIKYNLPKNWLGGWDNVMISVAVEDSYTAYTKIPELLNSLDLGVRHLGLYVSPLLENIDILTFIGSGLLEYVEVAGESYGSFEDSIHELKLEWVRKISNQCKFFKVPFKFKSTGSRIVVNDGRAIDVDKGDQSGLADFYKLNVLENQSVLSNWKFKAEEIERRHTAELAYKVRQLIAENTNNSKESVN